MNKMPQYIWTPRSVQDTQDFFARHGNGLSDVLNATSGDAGLDLFCEVTAYLEDLTPDPGRIGRAVRSLCTLLEQAEQVEDKYDAPLRWHGARMSDLAARLPELKSWP